MPGKLIDDKIIVESQEEGNQIYNKGYFGKPLSGGGVELNLFEGIYLTETERLDITDQNGNEILKDELLQKALSKNDRSLIQYPVYRDMRRRGYVVKKASDPADFRVYPRGGGPSKTPSKYWLFAKAENDNFSIDEVDKNCERINQLKKKMLVGINDEEGDVTYYKISTIDLKGKVKKYGKKPLKGVLYGNKILVKNPNNLHETQFYGNFINNELYLSIIETLYLVNKDVLKVIDCSNNKSLSFEDLKDIGRSNQDNFEILYKLYYNLRERGIIPKTGFKYGTAFRCYIGDPDSHHAEYMVQPVSKSYEVEWYHVSRAVRVAHTVKKDFVYGLVKDGSINYLKIERETP